MNAPPPGDIQTSRDTKLEEKEPHGQAPTETESVLQPDETTPPAPPAEVLPTTEEGGETGKIPLEPGGAGGEDTQEFQPGASSTGGSGRDVERDLEAGTGTPPAAETDEKRSDDSEDTGGDSGNMERDK